MKTRILTEANRLFLELGFKTVTMDDIAAKVGISKKTLYQHFENKKVLVQSSLSYIFESIRDKSKEIQALNLNPIEEFFIIKQHISAVIGQQRPIARHQLQKFYPEEFRSIQARQLNHILEMLKTNIERGKAAGLYLQEIEEDFAARMYYNLMSSTKDTDIYPEDRYDIQDLLNLIINYFIRSITTEIGHQTLQRINLEQG